MVLHRQADGSLKNMHVAYYPDLVLMFASINHEDDTITITYRPPLDSSKQERSLKIPLEPATSELQEIEVEMHKSPTKAFDMGVEYNTWLSECLGYDVVLAYLGPHLRSVLMSGLHNPAGAVQPNNGTSTSSWLSSVTSRLPTSLATGLMGGQKEEDKITFADCAPYLVVSDKSMEDVSNRLPTDQEMDITKFRPNIIVSGAEKPWEEDYWAELQIGTGDYAATIHCLHNCGRCQSINIGMLNIHLPTNQASQLCANQIRLRNWETRDGRIRENAQISSKRPKDR